MEQKCICLRQEKCTKNTFKKCRKYAYRNCSHMLRCYSSRDSSSLSLPMTILSCKRKRLQAVKGFITIMALSSYTFVNCESLVRCETAVCPYPTLWFVVPWFSYIVATVAKWTSGCMAMGRARVAPLGSVFGRRGGLPCNAV